MSRSLRTAVAKTAARPSPPSYAKLEARIAELTAELCEAREQQTATAEVLQVINSSPGDLAPVFDAMLDKALRLCGAAFGALFTYDGECFPCVATRGFPPALLEYYREPVRNLPGSAMGRLVHGQSTSQVTDIRADALRSPLRRALADLGGARTMIWVALRKERSLLGCIAIYRQEVRPFSEKEVALLENFAAQAVIAMENARLITETRERTRDLQESLEYQTATSDVLKVISRSTFDLQAVLDALVVAAARLCVADTAHIAERQGEAYRAIACFSYEPEFEIWVRNLSVTPGRGTVGGRSLLECRAVQVSDVTADPEYILPEVTSIGRIRTLLAVPLLREGRPIGLIVLGRTRAEPFTDRQVELITTFADQAVIAMENARLLTETREALEQQTATAEVLGVINSSPGDLAPVFDAMLDKAMRLCEADSGILLTIDGNSASVVAERDVPRALMDFLAQQPPVPGPDTFFGRAVLGRSILHTPDMRTEAAYLSGQPLTVIAVDQAGVRALLMAPLAKDNAVLGVFAIFRREPRPFTDKQIALLQNFAAQAVIAMENARLITETREALEQQTATAEVLGVINSSPGDLAPVFDAILEKAHRLCGAALGSLGIFDGETWRAVVQRGYGEPLASKLRQGGRGSDNPLLQELIDGAPLVHVADLAQLDLPIARANVAAGVRTLLIVALRKDDAVLGTISIARREPRPFYDKEIALLENFAAQAVIAVENARLINETREALEQQTATAEVLQVINSSPGDLTPVFAALLEKALRLCGGSFGELRTYDGERFRLAATHGVPTAYVQYYARGDRAFMGPAPGRRSSLPVSGLFISLTSSRPSPISAATSIASHWSTSEEPAPTCSSRC